MKKIFGFEIDKVKGWFGYWLLVGGSVLVLFFLITVSLIGYSVKEKCEIAKARYGGDCVEALMVTLNNEESSFKERNDAIWALGQMGDERALATVERYYTGQIPDREPYNGVLSQYEMKKAIKLLKGGFNATHWLWRRGVE